MVAGHLGVQGPRHASFAALRLNHPGSQSLSTPHTPPREEGGGVRGGKRKWEVCDAIQNIPTLRGAEWGREIERANQSPIPKGDGPGTDKEAGSL